MQRHIDNRDTIYNNRTTRRTPGEHGPQKQLSSTYSVTEIEAVIMDPEWFCIRSPVYTHCAFLLWEFVGLQTVELGYLWLHCLLFRPLSACWIFFFSFGMVISMKPYCILLWWVHLIFLRCLLFPEGKVRIVHMGKIGERGLGGIEGCGAVMRMYCMRWEQIKKIKRKTKITMNMSM